MAWCAAQRPSSEKGCTPGQLTLTRLLAQGEDVVLIPGYVFSSTSFVEAEIWVMAERRKRNIKW
jgi:hypothetical protein